MKRKRIIYVSTCGLLEVNTRNGFWIRTFALEILVVVPVKCDADDTASFDGIPPAFGWPASLFRLVLSAV